MKLGCLAKTEYSLMKRQHLVQQNKKRIVHLHRVSRRQGFSQYKDIVWWLDKFWRSTTVCVTKRQIFVYLRHHFTITSQKINSAVITVTQKIENVLEDKISYRIVEQLNFLSRLYDSLDWTRTFFFLKGP
jgi:hypothetical protein